MRKVNLGCGGNKLPGCENYDQEVDITKPLPWKDKEIAAVFAEHVMEHITPAQVLGFLEECKRVLQPGGYLRITVPSVEKVEGRMTPAYREFSRKFGGDGTTAGAIKPLITQHGHQSVWNTSLLMLFIRTAGFKDVREGSLYQSPYGKLEGHDKVIGAENNEIESITVEARA